MKIKVAAAQMSCSWEIEENISKAKILIDKAAKKGANIILLQELFQTPYFCIQYDEEIFKLAQTFDNNKILDEMSKIAKDLNKDNANIICVIGDGALSAGMAYEALNNVGATNKQMIVILNDNKMSIDRPVGAMSNYLTKLLSSKQYTSVRSLLKKISAKLPKTVYQTLYKAEEYSKGLVAGGTLFEELGFYYLGPIDGHDINTLVPILENIKNLSVCKQIFIH